jgi:lysophospholipase L1-like esterase
MRATDAYMPAIADRRLAGVEVECTAAWQAYSDTMRDAAAAFAVPTVSMYDAFNGPDHAEDPRQKGHIISDGEHTSPAGRQAMVAALYEACYEPVQRDETHETLRRA